VLQINARQSPPRGTASFTHCRVLESGLMESELAEKIGMADASCEAILNFSLLSQH
jgi:hypothetical protein